MEYDSRSTSNSSASSDGCVFCGVFWRKFLRRDTPPGRGIPAEQSAVHDVSRKPLGSETARSESQRHLTFAYEGEGTRQNTLPHGLDERDWHRLHGVEAGPLPEHWHHSYGISWPRGPHMKNVLPYHVIFHPPAWFEILFCVDSAIYLCCFFPRNLVSLLARCVCETHTHLIEDCGVVLFEPLHGIPYPITAEGRQLHDGLSRRDNRR